MSTEKIFLANPYNEEHLKLIDEYEIKSGNGRKMTSRLNNIRATYTKEEYLDQRKNKNEIEEILLSMKDSKIFGVCYIVGERDIKTCRITFFSDISKHRKLIIQATEYALNNLGFQEVFIKIDKNYKQIIDYLSTHGFESLGEENNTIIFLKEKEEKIDYKGRYNENIRQH